MNAIGDRAIAKKAKVYLPQMLRQDFEERKERPSNGQRVAADKGAKRCAISHLNVHTSSLYSEVSANLSSLEAVSSY